MTQQTAILLFSRSAHAETLGKGFGGSQADDLRVAGALIRRTLHTTGRAGMPVFHYDERRQRGDTFGRRMATAVSDIFARGFEHLIIVGNDAPQLRVGHLHRAAGELAEGRSVIGADRRGGAWLIGLQGADFDPQVFADLAWQTPRLADQLTDYLGESSRLPQLFDVNKLFDLSRSWVVLHSLLSQLADLLSRRIRVRTAVQFFYRLTPSAGVSGRAPPLSA